MRVGGLSSVSDPRTRFEDKRKTHGESKRLPDPFRGPQDAPASPRWGRTLEGEEELDRLWDSGEIDRIQVPPPSSKPAEVRQPDGLTDLERMEKAYGYKPALAYAMESAKISKGFHQPTTKGQRFVEPNVLELRRRFGNV